MIRVVPRAQRARNAALTSFSVLVLRRAMRDYSKQIKQFWPTILQAWNAHADKRPVIECDLANKKVRAYASGEYIDSLSGRTREATRRDFAHTMDEGGIMIFILDAKNRVLQSHSIPTVGVNSDGNPCKGSQRITNPSQVRKKMKGRKHGHTKGDNHEALA